MPLDLSQTLVVGITSTALFDLAEIDREFREREAQDPQAAIRWYRDYMVEREDEPLPWGTGYPLVRALLHLNQYAAQGELPLVEVVVMSRNSPETGLRIMKNLRREVPTITRSVFTGGESVVPYLSAFDVSLFLTTDIEDAQNVTQQQVCAAGVLYRAPEEMDELPPDQVRIALDGDAVLFDGESERTYQSQGLEAFLAQEAAAEDIPLRDGPYAGFLRKLATLEARLPMGTEYAPVRIALVTARNGPADLRVVKTLRHWNVYVDAAFFLGDVRKADVLRAFKPHIFFDDQDIHLEPARGFVPAAKVLGRSDGGAVAARADAPESTL